MKLFRKNFSILGTEQGFTLVELLVVVAIISILGTLARFGYDGYQEGARQSEAKLSLGNLLTAQDQFKTEYGQYLADMNAIKYLRKGSKAWYSVGVPGVNCGMLTADTLAYTTVSASYSLQLQGNWTTFKGGASGSAADGCSYTGYTQAIDTSASGCQASNLDLSTLPGGVTVYPAMTTTATSFKMAAVGSIKGKGGCDVWTIDSAGTIKNDVSGR